jgi:hypothetical protein
MTNTSSLEGKTLSIPQANGMVDIVTITKVEHIATVANQSEADRITGMLTSAITSTGTVVVPPVRAARGTRTTTTKKAVKKTAARRALDRKKAATKATRKVSARKGKGSPGKTAVDVKALTTMVENATK